MKRDCSLGRQLFCLHLGSSPGIQGLWPLFPATQSSLEEVLRALQLPSLNWVQQENEGILWTSALFIKDKEARETEWQGLGLGAGSGSSQLAHTCLFHTHLPDLQPRRDRKGVWGVRQRMGGASAQANCSGSDLWETNEGRVWAWNLSCPGLSPICQETVPYLIRVLA